MSDISRVSVRGSFRGSTFLNKLLTPPTLQTESRVELRVAEPYDRVYRGVSDCMLVDDGKDRALMLDATGGWRDTVVWSPFGSDAMGFNRFLCVESAAVDPVILAPGASWDASCALRSTQLGGGQ